MSGDQSSGRSTFNGRTLWMALLCAGLIGGSGISTSTASTRPLVAHSQSHVQDVHTRANKSLRLHVAAADGKVAVSHTHVMANANHLAAKEGHLLAQQVQQFLVPAAQSHAEKTAWYPMTWNPALMGSRTMFTYERIKGYQGTLYVFRPKHMPRRPMPVVVYFHGGSLIHGTAIIRNGPKYGKEWVMTQLERSLVSHGFAFVSVNYRLAPEHKWPSQIEDAKTSIRFLKAYAGKLHLDPSRFSVIGDSAGGALASLVGLTGSQKRYQHVFTTGPWQKQSTRVQSVVDLFGPVDRSWYATKWAARYGSRPTPVFGVLDPKLIRTASAVSYIKRNAPRFLIVQGLQDPVDPPWLSMELFDKLRISGDSARILLINHSSHEFIPVGGALNPSVPKIVKTVASFLERYDGRSSDAHHLI